MKITGDWIDASETQAVCAVLVGAGYEALFVGGCVRDALLGKPVSDIDISTDAEPSEVIALTEAAGLKAVPTGIDHGTITVVSGGIPHEVTTFRRDVETFGRHAVVAFAKDVRHDAQRRDFTMNALYARPDGEVVDPLGGLSDLQQRKVRFIEDPEQRIKEDYLRILRFFRFTAWYGDPANGPDPEALSAVAKLAAGLEDLSRERVTAEMKKLLTAPDPAPAVAAMRSTGVLSHVLAGADDRALAPLVHLEALHGAEVDPIRRLALLGGTNHAEHLRLSKAEDRLLCVLKEQVGALSGAAELGYQFGPETGLSILLLRAALFETLMPAAFEAQLNFGAAATFPVKADDLMPGLKGPELGARLKELERIWIGSGFALSKKELLEH